MELKYIILIVAVVFLFLIIVGLSIVNYSTEDMLEEFKKASKYSVGTTPKQFAERINAIFFNNTIKIRYKSEFLSDCFNGGGYLTLCSIYANKDELAGIAICAHELGHAFQFKEKREMMVAHAKKISLTKAISWLISPLIIAGIVLLLFSYIIPAIVCEILALTVFFIAIITKLSTLNIERDTSKRALELLRTYENLSDEQLIIAKKFLNSAKQTYLAELLRIVLKWTFLVKKR